MTMGKMLGSRGVRQNASLCCSNNKLISSFQKSNSLLRAPCFSLSSKWTLHGRLRLRRRCPGQQQQAMHAYDDDVRDTTTRYTTNNQLLLQHLLSLSEEQLEEWAAESRDEITISFLAYIEQREGEEPTGTTEQQRLWDLAGRLMALREGFTPLTAAKLREELSQAAEPLLQSRSKSLSSIEQPASSLGASMTAELGLSVQGMKLLEQQAAALEATLGSKKAQSLVEVLGRKRVNGGGGGGGMQRMHAADAANRILEVLVQIESREERSMMLPDAFTPTPPPTTTATGGMCESDIEEDEQLSTTPFALLQAVDLWLQRLGSRSDSSTNSQEEFNPGRPALRSRGGSGDGDMFTILHELREDILRAWDSSADSSSGDEGAF